MQRILKYPLLLDELIKHFDPTHHAYRLLMVRSEMFPLIVVCPYNCAANTGMFCLLLVLYGFVIELAFCHEDIQVVNDSLSLSLPSPLSLSSLLPCS